MLGTHDVASQTSRLAERYSSSAADYARLWSPVIRPMGQRLLRALPLDGANHVLDVGTAPGTDVYAPVDGSVMAVSDQIVNGKPYGVRIDIQPSGNPGVVVTLSNLRPDPALSVGMTVSAGRTKIGRIIDLSSVEQAALARYTQDRGQHVHIEVHAAGTLAVP